MPKVSISDRWLRRALQEVLGSKEITSEALAELEELDWSEYRAEAELPWGAIGDLAPLVHCPGLRKLTLDGNQVEDLASLAGCAELEELWLVDNGVQDLTSLSRCLKLQTLCLESNRSLSDIAPLRGLPALEYLNIADSRVQDISPLLELPALKKVTLYSLPLDLTPDSTDYKVLTELLRRGVEIHFRGIEAVQAAVRESMPAAGPAESLVERVRALGAFEVARLIEEQGINGQGEKMFHGGLTSLQLAARWYESTPDPVTDRLALVNELLSEPGIEVDGLNMIGETALNAYLRLNAHADLEVVRRLLIAGADPNTVSPYGYKPLLNAIEVKNEAVVSLLIEYGADNQDARQVNLYCQKGLIERVRTALSEGYDPNTPDSNFGSSALHAAAFGKQPEIVRLLLEHGVDVKALDHAGETPLHKAWHKECMELLLERGAEVDAVGTSGRTPLFTMVEYIYPECVRLLIEHGADVNHQDENGNTPLHICRYEGYKAAESLAMVNYLIDCGAAVNVLNAREQTPMDCYRQSEMRATIRGRGGKTGKTVLKRKA